MQRRTKIVATLGPATSDPDTIKAMVVAGADVFRLNAAHGTPADHVRHAERARSAAESAGRTVGLLVDLPGPKLRTGEVEGDLVHLDTGQRFVLTEDAIVGTNERVSTSIDDFARLVEPGGDIYLADGEIVLRVESEQAGEVHTTVLRGGALRSRKGMSVPGAERSVAAFTESDEVAFRMAQRIRADFVGLSFVRDEHDILRVQRMLPKRGHRPGLVAKIETRSSLAHLSAIAEHSDAVMVARGDLGIQVDVARVPLIQKDVIRIANRYGTPVITATQMLLSMTNAPIPTRAEATDVTNAVLDGTDALMLSEETAVGDYPVETVATMARVATTAETWPREHPPLSDVATTVDPVTWAIARSAVEAASDVGAAAILCPTRSGATPRRVAAFRPRIPVIGLSNRLEVQRRLTISRGVLPLPIDSLGADPDEPLRCVDYVKEKGLIAAGDLVVVASGSPTRRAGSTDALRVVRA